VAKAIVVLPDMRGEQVVEGGDRSAPGNMVATLKPLSVLIKHRVNNVDKRLIAGEEAMTSCEQIAFQPALAGMLAEDFHHPTVSSKMVVMRAFHPPRCDWSRQTPNG